MAQEKPPKKKGGCGIFIARYFGGCFLAFGLLVLWFGLGLYALPFLLLGIFILYATTKHFRRLITGAPRSEKQGK